MSYSGSGDVTAPVTRPAAGDCAPGCEAADFTGFPAGNIALIQRGPPGSPARSRSRRPTPSAAGAVGVVIYNNAAGPLNGTLRQHLRRSTSRSSGITQALGQRARRHRGPGPPASQTETLRTTTTTSNVLAELPGKNTDNVVMAGAHLDSVDGGPGHQRQRQRLGRPPRGRRADLAKVRPQNTLRFAWWGAEEASLVGSTYYVTNLSAGGAATRIALYLNFDMIGSPNYVFFIYDGDDSDATARAPDRPVRPRSRRPSRRSTPHAASPFKGTDFTGSLRLRAVHRGRHPRPVGCSPVPRASRPRRRRRSGVAPPASAYDPCYHQACDTLRQQQRRRARRQLRRHRVRRAVLRDEHLAHQRHQEQGQLPPGDGRPGAVSPRGPGPLIRSAPGPLRRDQSALSMSRADGLLDGGLPRWPRRGSSWRRVGAMVTPSSYWSMTRGST